MATTATGGSLTAASPLLPFSVGDAGVVGVEVSGTWTGTITFEARIGNTWANAQVFTTAGVAAAATTTANVSRLINTAGFSEVRANFSTPTSGSPAVIFTGSPESMGGSGGGGGGGGAVTIADGADVAEGTTTDAGIITDIAGTQIGFQRGNIKMWLNYLARIPAALISGRLDVNLGAAPAAITLGAGTASAANVGGLTKTIDSTITRPNTAGPPAYTANDEMTNSDTTIRTITGAATASGGKGIITHCSMSCSSNATTKPSLTVFVYDTTSTPAADNAAFAPSDAVQDTCIGSFQLNASEVGDATGSTGNFTMDSGQIHIPYTTVGSADLYFRVKVNNAYTAGTISDTYKFRWKVQQDAN